MAQIGRDINYAATLLKEGRCVAIPTETVYGLAANAFDADACLNIFKIKNRPEFDPLIVHCHSLQQIKQITKTFPNKAELLLNIFSPGPLTLLMEKNKLIPEIVTAGLPTVGVRIPSHPMTLNLLQQLNFPLAAPSANPFGYVSPTTAQHVNEQLGHKIDYILDGGPTSVGIESTIVGFENKKAVIHRLGGISVEQIESVIGRVELRISSHSNPKAPGQTDAHYAPLKPLIVKTTGELRELINQNTNACFIVFSKELLNQNNSCILPLTIEENFDEAAKNLFSIMRKADKSPSSIIFAELLPDIALGRAINDRLNRASKK